MRLRAFFAAATLALGAPLVAQESKPVPKDSVRVAIPGCSKGYVFTVGPRTTESAGTFEIAEGTHLRMNGPKKLMADIKAHEGAPIEITGLMRKGQTLNPGVNVGGGVRIGPAPSPGSVPVASEPYIDVESWRLTTGRCVSR